jgi:SecD/SecF fusion protein
MISPVYIALAGTLAYCIIQLAVIFMQKRLPDWLRPFATWRVAACVFPVVVSAFIVWLAYEKYKNGEGGFRLGVDLSGGTNLVYEVDLSKMTPEAASDFREDKAGKGITALAAMLKRRIDPADLYNATIRPVAGDPPRVEIILPTGGRQQAQAAEAAWQDVLNKVKDEYKDLGDAVHYEDIPQGQYKQLTDSILEAYSKLHKDIDQTKVSSFVYGLQKRTSERRSFTGEEVEDIKNLIQQQGRLEFRILANNTDDKEAIAAAKEDVNVDVELYAKPWDEVEKQFTKRIDDLKAQAEKEDKAKADQDKAAAKALEDRLESRRKIRDTDQEKTLIARAQLLQKLAVEGNPPPPPTQNGDRSFAVTLQGETSRYQYSWVEVGKEELYSLRLNSDAEHNSDPDPGRDARRRVLWAAVSASRDKDGFYDPPAATGGQTLLYSRTIPNPERILPRDSENGKKVEYFVLTRETPPGKEVTGDFLTSAGEGVAEAKRAVNFSFDSEGAARFMDLTTLNQPAGPKDTDFHRQLAVVLDNQVRSAPNLNAVISSNGQITGEFTPKEVEDLVRILRAGALPATLKSKPVSETTKGATLGEDTIFKGTLSVGLAFAAVLIFMLIYYRFAGIVACIALLANLLLTVAFMVLVQATFTLPGLAGLVLMLGMAVDANVLIYERLREERERGASLALAIRNGYDRAFPTIIDTHLTSIFTAVVLYVVGNDQLKGFGISLTVGLIISLFTSLFVTRTIFDIWMGRNWIHKLTFMQLFKRPNINFMKIRYYMFGLTVGLTVVGGALFIYHLNNGGLNIDFVGGTAYSGRLVRPITVAELRDKLDPDKRPMTDADRKEMALTDQERAELGTATEDLPDVSIEPEFVSDPTLSQGDKSALFTVRTSVKDAALVQKVVNQKLGDLLKRIDMKDPSIQAQNGKASEATLEFVKSDDPTTAEVASPAQVTLLLNEVFKDLGVKKFTLSRGPQAVAREGRFSQMVLTLDQPIPVEDLSKALAKVQADFRATPQPERLENFDSQLARDTQMKALEAILASWIAILLYLWFRFGSWTFGAATVLCLIHDLFFTLGAIALCHYIYLIWPGFLGIADFKIDLPAVAALLTLVGYSVSDTIVVFDRIREVRGKNPLLTYTMINDSVNQTLSRTILSSLTVFLVVGVLYIFGGVGVHLFAFVMVVGVIVGTYSSIYIASPLLIMFGEGLPRTERAKAAAAAAAAAADVAPAQA